MESDPFSQGRVAFGVVYLFIDWSLQQALGLGTPQPGAARSPSGGSRPLPASPQPGEDYSSRHAQRQPHALAPPLGLQLPACTAPPPARPPPPRRPHRGLPSASAGSHRDGGALRGSPPSPPRRLPGSPGRAIAKGEDARAGRAAAPLSEL